MRRLLARLVRLLFPEADPATRRNEPLRRTIIASGNDTSIIQIEPY